MSRAHVMGRLGAAAGLAMLVAFAGAATTEGATAASATSAASTTTTGQATSPTPAIAPAPAAASAARVSDAATERRLLALARELRCLVCQNESLADSQAGLAEDLRREMRSMIRAGRSDDEIVAFLVERYGDFVRYRPPVAPRTWLLWGGPALGVALGLGVLALVVRRRRAMPAEAPLDAADRERLARLLAEDER